MQKYDFFLNLRKCGLRMERLNVKNAFFSFFLHRIVDNSRKIANLAVEKEGLQSTRKVK
ncbi:MAG: hypothetical protein SPM02_09085 [Bacteroidales bacterium]|nr:hypothetical protein [Bacteroidales bacterium]